MKLDYKFPNFKHSIMLCISIYIIMYLVLFVLHCINYLLFNGNIDIVNSDSLQIMVTIITYGIIFYYSINKNPDLKYSIKIGGRLNLQIILIFILFATGMVFILSSLNNILYYYIKLPTYLNQYINTILYEKNIIVSLLTIVIIAPITEEVLFRGIILNGLLNHYDKRTAIILSSILFGLFHINPYQIFAAIILGLFFGWIYYEFNSIKYPILVHAIYNFIPVFIIRILKIRIKGFSSPEFGHFQPLGLTIIGFGLSLIGFYLLRFKIIEVKNKEKYNVELRNIDEE